MNASTQGASTNPGSRSSDFGTARENVSDALNRGKEGLSNAASTLANNASTDMESLRKDLNSLKDTVSQFISQAGEVSSSVANQVSGAARISRNAEPTWRRPPRTRPELRIGA